MRTMNKFCLVSDTLFGYLIYFIFSEDSLFVNFICWCLVSIRRSGRLSNRERPKGDNQEYETIDLNIDGDSEDEQGISETTIVYNVYELVYVCKLLTIVGQLNMMHVHLLNICLIHV